MRARVLALVMAGPAGAEGLVGDALCRAVRDRMTIDIGWTHDDTR